MNVARKIRNKMTSNLDINSFTVIDEVKASDEEEDCLIQEPEVAVVLVEDDNKDKEENPDEVVLIEINFKQRDYYNIMKCPLVDFLTSSLKTKMKDVQVEVVHDDAKKSIQVLKKPEDTDGIFVIDSAPSNPKNALIPSYKKVINSVMDNEIKASLSDPGLVRCRPRNTCWNCGGEHGIRECTEPRNYTKINKAKSDFGKRNERYHVDLEQKYGHIIPGDISENLRQALGLKAKDIPMHVYRMRLFGYPPGWLEEAKVTHSGMTMFDSTGERVIESDEDEGEIEVEKYKYDIRKIVNFPGFNVDAGKHVYDDSKFYKVPPQMPYQSREALIASLEGNLVQGYKRKKQKKDPFVEDPSDVVELENCDMEVENDADADIEHPNLLASAQSKIIEINDSLVEGTSQDNSVIFIDEKKAPSRSSSPSLEDLRQQQALLLAQLADSSACSDSAGINNSLEDSLMEDVLMIEKLAEEEAQKEKSRPPPPPEEAKPPPPPIEELDFKATALGTPVLKSFSPFSRLPTGQQFSVGVCDVINFENLPDSTGKYEKMKTLIYKVRDITAKLNRDN